MKEQKTIEKEYFTPSDLIKMGLFKDKDTIYKLIKNNELKAFKIQALGHSNWRIKKEEIERIESEGLQCQLGKEEKSTGTTSVLGKKDIEALVLQKLKK